MCREDEDYKIIVPRLEGNVCVESHAVLLGAGASLAAFPDGDANGRELPLMNNLVEKVGLSSFLKEKGVKYEGKNFELLYQQICSDPSLQKYQSHIESVIYEYFKCMELPDYPTIYDYLLLFLREKDWILSFNWDPFLLQACLRNMEVKKLPRVAFLHGNVLQAVCYDCKRWGYAGTICLNCGKELLPSQLLFPIGNKDYNSDPLIKNEWNTAREVFNQAYYLTIFGYSAPDSDSEAVELLLKSWKSNSLLKQSEIEIIDIKKRDELAEKWNPFVFSHHVSYKKSFFDSLLYRQPRRCCDNFAMAALNMRPMKKINIPEFKTIYEIHEWIQPYLEEERRYETEGSSFNYNIGQYMGSNV